MNKTVAFVKNKIRSFDYSSLNIWLH